MDRLDTSTTPADRMWTVEDIARFLQVTARTVNNYRKADRSFPTARVLPGHRSVRWYAADIIAWVDQLPQAA